MKKLSEALSLPNLTDLHLFLQRSGNSRLVKARLRVAGSISQEVPLEIDLPWAMAENIYSEESLKTGSLDEGVLFRGRGIRQQVGDKFCNLRLTYSESLGQPVLFVRIQSGTPPPIENVSGDYFFELMNKANSNSLGPGMILVSGQAGSGKSTYIASVLQHIVKLFPIHIVSLEDPVEYTISPMKGYATQKDVYFDSPSFQDALRACMREDPDVLYVGEVRDHATAETALTAAESGHLVFGTIHAGSNAGIVDRLLGLFGTVAPEFVAQRIAQCLRLCLSIRRSGMSFWYTYEEINDPLRNVIRNQALHHWKLYSSQVVIEKKGL